MIFLTTGQKIRTLRKKLNMRQQELEGENITRAFISMIETGKRGLSRETAKHIADKFNNKGIELGISLNIDGNYFLRTPEEDAEVYCLEKLNNSPTRDEVDVIISICKGYHLTKVEAQAYKILADGDYISGNWVDAFINYMISLDLYKETEYKESLSYIYNRLGSCRSKQAKYKEAVSFFQRSIYYSKLYNDDILSKEILYNLAYTHKMLGEYDEALEAVEKCILLCNKEVICKDYVYGSVLKANCYSRKGNNEKAIIILEELLKRFKEKESEFIGYIYNNLALVYLEQDNLVKSLECLENAEKLLENKKMLASIYIDKARVYIKKEMYDGALKFANAALKVMHEYDDIEYILKAYEVMIIAYSNPLDFQNLKSIYIKLMDILKNKEYYKEHLIKVYNRLALLYLEQNDIEMCKKYLNMVS